MDFMTLHDFHELQYFNMLDVCHVSMNSFDVNDNIGWNKQEIRGSWSNDTNPKYLVELKDTDTNSDDTCTCLISLLQVGGRRKRAEGETYEESFPPICKFEFHTGAKILNSSKNSHLENIIFHKVHFLKVSLFTKFTI